MRAVDTNTRDLDLFQLKYGHGDGFTIPGAEKHYPPDLELEPIHLDIDLLVDLEVQAASGTVTVTVTARRDGPTQLALHAVSFEDVVGARRRRARLGLAATMGRRSRSTGPNRSAGARRRRVAVSYRVERPGSGLYFSKPVGGLPERAAGSRSPTTRPSARGTGCPASTCPTRDRCLDFHLRAAGPASRSWPTARSWARPNTSDGTKTAHWRLDFPCPSYLTCFAIGDFVRADDGEHDGKPIAYFAPSTFTADDLRRSFGRTGEMLDWMTTKLDMPFPFPKYFQFAATGVGGAMENISLVAWDDIFVMDETLAAEWTRLLDEINVHEMAHSYFGDAVVCRDYAHAWLKESWATYIEQVWFGETRSARRGQLTSTTVTRTRTSRRRTSATSGPSSRASSTRRGTCTTPTCTRAARAACTRCAKSWATTTFWAAVRDYLKTLSAGRWSRPTTSATCSRSTRGARWALLRPVVPHGGVPADQGDVQVRRQAPRGHVRRHADAGQGRCEEAKERRPTTGRPRSSCRPTWAGSIDGEAHDATR